MLSIKNFKSSPTFRCPKKTRNFPDIPYVTHDAALSVWLNHEERHADTHPHIIRLPFSLFPPLSLSLVVQRSFPSRHARCSPNKPREAVLNAPPSGHALFVSSTSLFSLFSRPRMSPGHPRAAALNACTAARAPFAAFSQRSRRRHHRYHRRRYHRRRSPRRCSRPHPQRRRPQPPLVVVLLSPSPPRASSATLSADFGTTPENPKSDTHIKGKIVILIVMLKPSNI